MFDMVAGGGVNDNLLIRQPANQKSGSRQEERRAADKRDGLNKCTFSAVLSCIRT